MLTEQEIFTKAYETLRERGFTRAGWTDEDGCFGCQYRSPHGPCAIGALIPDEVYSSTMEGHGVLWILENPSIASIFEGVSGTFLFELQHAHDSGYTPDAMRRNLHRVARDFNLRIPT